jgi:hypothetical protein
VKLPAGQILLFDESGARIPARSAPVAELRHG